MLTEALIEREIRASMKTEASAASPLPRVPRLPSPSAPRILEIFSHIQRHQLMNGTQVVQVFQPELTPLQRKVLALLHVLATAHTSTNAS